MLVVHYLRADMADQQEERISLAFFVQLQYESIMVGDCIRTCLARYYMCRISKSAVRSVCVLLSGVECM